MDWDYEKLMAGIAALEAAALTAKDREAIDHTIEFLEWNIEEGEILSPLQTYLTQK